MAQFSAFLPVVLKHEGFYANVVGDNGGETYRGIARRKHPSWAGWAIVDRVKAQNGGRLRHNHRIVSPELDRLIERFYLLNFWNPLSGNDFRSQKIADVVIDLGVNSGVERALQMLRVVTASKPGTPVKTLIEKANAIDENVLLGSMLLWRKRYYDSLVKAKPEQAKFLAGWMRRIKSFGEIPADIIKNTSTILVLAVIVALLVIYLK